MFTWQYVEFAQPPRDGSRLALWRPHGTNLWDGHELLDDGKPTGQFVHVCYMGPEGHCSVGYANFYFLTLRNRETAEYINAGSRLDLAKDMVVKDYILYGKDIQERLRSNGR